MFINSNKKNYFEKRGEGDIGPFIKTSIFQNKLFLASH
jgi:hypothetical protein